MMSSNHSPYVVKGLNNVNKHITYIDLYIDSWNPTSKEL